MGVRWLIASMIRGQFLATSSVGFYGVRLQDIVLGASGSGVATGHTPVGCHRCGNPGERGVCMMATGLEVTDCHSCLRPSVLLQPRPRPIRIDFHCRRVHSNVCAQGRHYPVKRSALVASAGRHRRCSFPQPSFCRSHKRAVPCQRHDSTANIAVLGLYPQFPHRPSPVSAPTSEH
jgi:hypothetical protein